MSQKGISFRLNSHVTAFAILIISAIVYINYHFSNKILIRKIEEGAINQSNLVISRIARITIGTEEIAKNVSFQALYYQQHNDLELFLQQVLKANPILESIHVEFFDDESNKFSVCNSTGKCPHRCNTNKDIFPVGSDTLSSGGWSKPFFCMNDTSHLLVSFKRPVYVPNSKVVAGEVFCEISLRKMNQMLSELKIGNEGFAFIINDAGEYITHPVEQWILSRNFFKNASIDSGDMQTKIESQIRLGKPGASQAKSEYLNKEVWFYYAPLTNTNWRVIIVVPKAELFDEIDLIFKKIIWVCGLGILLLFIMNMLIFRRIMDPLVNITRAIQHFTSLPGTAQQSKDEIKMLTDSLHNWQSKYGSLLEEQKQTETAKRKIEKDLKSAREIQRSILPEGKFVFPEQPGLDLFATLKPAEKVGGDLYDFFMIDSNHLLLAIGDVSGKGIPASLFMAVASTLIKTNANILSSKDIVQKVNRELSSRNADQYFLTLFIGIIDLRSGMMDYCNAAHNFPYILGIDGSLKTLSHSHGLPLGIYKDKSYKSSTVELKYFDTLILYTDGVINAIDSKNHLYGTDRLEQNLRNMNDLTSEEIINRLLKSIQIYEGESHQSDDITLLALRYNKEEKSQA